MRLAIACAAAVLLTGCQALKVAGDVLDALPPPTPQEQCEQGGGRWRSITTYDAQGNPTAGGGECVQGDPHKKDQHK